MEKGETLETVVCFFCTIHVRGQAVVAATVFGGVEITGTVSEVAVAAGGGVKLVSGGKVGETIVALGGPVEQGAGTTLPADVTAFPWIQLPGQRQIFWRGALGLQGLTILLAFLSYALLRKRRVENVAGTVAGRKIAALLTGLFALVVLLLMVIYSEDAGDWEDYVIYGALLGFFLLGVPGFSAVALGAGRVLPRNHAAGAGSILTGAILLALLMLIPVAGLLVWLLAMSLSSGALVLSRFGGYGPAALPADALKAK